MTGINHALTGAVIAVVVKQPVLVVPLAFASHFVLDTFPHFGLKLDVLERNKNKAYKTVISVDIPLIILSLIIVPILVKPVVPMWLTFVSMLAAIGPDFAWVYRYINEVRTQTFMKPNRFNKFHKTIQRFESPHGLIVEVIYLGIVSIILMKLV